MTAYIKKNGAWVEVKDLHVKAGGSFRRALTGYVKNGGVWKQTYVYVPEMPTTTTVAVSNYAPVAPSTAVTISGTVLRTSDSSPVPTGSAVELWNGGAKLLTTTTNASGNYSFSWSPALTGDYNLTVKFPANGYYTASQVNTSTITASTTTAVSISVPGPTVINAPFYVTGTVTSATGQVPDNGPLEISWSTDQTNWLTIMGGSSSGGTFSILMTYDVSTTVYWRVRYVGIDNYAGSYSAPSSVAFVYPALTTNTITAESMTNTGFTLRATAPYATSYDFYRNGVYFGTLAGNGLVSSTVTWSGNYTGGLPEDSSWSYYVVAKNNNNVTGSVTSATKTYSTGHAAIIDSGTWTGATWNAAETGSYRSSDGWSALGSALAQGYFSANPYTGVARFDDATMRANVDAYGVDRAGRWNHAACTKLEVYATRKTGSGSSSAVQIGWYMTDHNPGSGVPSLALGPDTSSPSGLAQGDSDWLQLPDETWGTNLIKGVYQSIAMYHNGSSRYSQYNGGTGFKVRMTLTWNYTFRTLVSPTFS